MTPGPRAATLAKDWIFEKVYSSKDRVLVHDSTLGANASDMAAGLASLAVIDDERLISSAERTGNALQNALRDMAAEYELLVDVRGRGLMIGLEFGKPRSLRLRAGWNMLQAARHGLFAQMAVVADDQGKRELPTPLHSQHIAHRGACGKSRVVPHNRWPRPEPADMGVAKCVCCCRRMGGAGTSLR